MQSKIYFKIGLYSFIILLCTLLIKNAGYYFDITSKPIKSDVIVCLGGGKGERLDKAISLLINDYSNDNSIIITSKYKNSILKKKKLLLKKNITNIISTYETQNTLEELLFIKKLIIKNSYKRIMIVTTNAHSKRTSLLINHFLDVEKLNITFNIVGTNPDWWNKKNYYKNKKAVFFVLKESLKIIYNFCYYTLNKYYNFNEETINLLYQIKKYLINYLNYIENLFN